MEERRKKSWFRFIVIVYALALLSSLLAIATTAYALTEHGFREANPFINSLMTNYGVIIGLILALFYAFSSILFFWVLFIPYLYFSKKRNDVERAGSFLYPLMSAFGMSNLTLYLMDVTNDVSLLLFHRSPISASQLIESWNALFILQLGIFLVIFLVLWHFSMRKRESKEKPSA